MKEEKHWQSTHQGLTRMNEFDFSTWVTNPFLSERYIEMNLRTTNRMLEGRKGYSDLSCLSQEMNVEQHTILFENELRISLQPVQVKEDPLWIHPHDSVDRNEHYYCNTIHSMEHACPTETKDESTIVYEAKTLDNTKKKKTIRERSKSMKIGQNTHMSRRSSSEDTIFGRSFIIASGGE